MRYFEPYTLNVSGKLLEVDSPIVMGILNATPDSFYSGSRCDSDEAVRMRVRQIVSEGGRIIDVGGYSSRPMADDVAPEDEWRRLSAALRIVRDEAPGAIVSVDTFRASIAERCVGEYGVDIVNDISSGQLDRAMIPTVARLKVPYVMMHMRGNPHTMQDFTDYGDVAADVMRFLGDRMKEAAYAGISDIILDPGFGFSKTLDQNYELLARMGLADGFAALSIGIHPAVHDPDTIRSLERIFRPGLLHTPFETVVVAGDFIPGSQITVQVELRDGRRIDPRGVVPSAGDAGHGQDGKKSESQDFHVGTFWGSPAFIVPERLTASRESPGRWPPRRIRRGPAAVAACRARPRHRRCPASGPACRSRAC